MTTRKAEQAGQTAAYHALLGLSLLFTIGAVVTLLPSPWASKPNILGYRSICPFAPAATAVCGLAAGITCVIRNRFVSVRKASARYSPLFIPIGVFAVLILIAGIATGAYLGAESRFHSVIASTEPAGTTIDGTGGALRDGVGTASVSEGEVSATVELMVEGGRIAELRLIDAENVEPPVADAIFEAVKASQSTTVDAVSGATASSNVLLRAIEAAAAAVR